MSITHQWSAGEVVNIKWIHLQLEVNTVGMLCAAEQDDKSQIHSPGQCFHEGVWRFCVTHRQRMSVWMSPA